MQVLDKLADLDRTVIVAESDRIDSQAGELIDQGDQGLQVFFDADVEGVAVLDVYGN